ncbi:hypothetical protein N431DRAFT_191135 [Stipitochalara longipes BDJ]|nr:hypothetical protein N431DRAFT_191135 [Stipitochalara longipes BDJ]
MQSHVFMRLFPIPANLNPGCWFTNDAEACPRRRRSSKEAIRGTSVSPKKMPFPPDGSVCGTEGHRDSLHLEAGTATLCSRILLIRRNSLVAEANQAILMLLLKAKRCTTSGSQSPFPTESSGSSEDWMRTSAEPAHCRTHCVWITADTLNFCRYQSLPFNLLHSNPLRHKP